MPEDKPDRAPQNRAAEQPRPPPNSRAERMPGKQAPTREAQYDKTLADSFPASDPPSSGLFTSISAPSTRTTGNEPVAAIDPGGTRPAPKAKTKTKQAVSSGDRNDV